MGFATSKSDSSLFVRQGRLGSVSILLYVDELVIAGVDLGEIDRVKLQLAASFDMKNLHYFLGIEVIHTPKGILISQRHYVLSMLSTPLDRTVKLRPDSRKVCESKRFREIVGRLIYLTITRVNLKQSM